MHIRSQKDFWAGLMFIAFGAFFGGFGSRYAFGNAAQMGPGYFPTVLGVVMGLLGLMVTIKSVGAGAAEEQVARFDWRTLGLVLGSVVLFGLLLVPLGLVLSLFVLVVISSLASHEFAWRATLVNAVVLIAMCLGVFVWGLKLQFPIWPALLKTAAAMLSVAPVLV